MKMGRRLVKLNLCSVKGKRGVSNDSNSTNVCTLLLVLIDTKLIDTVLSSIPFIN